MPLGRVPVYGVLCPLVYRQFGHDEVSRRCYYGMRHHSAELEIKHDTSLTSSAVLNSSVWTYLVSLPSRLPGIELTSQVTQLAMANDIPTKPYADMQDMTGVKYYIHYDLSTKRRARKLRGTLGVRSFFV
jgi:hypothetical protein